MRSNFGHGKGRESQDRSVRTVGSAFDTEIELHAVSPDHFGIETER